MEPDGEASYANCLLTTLANGPQCVVNLHPGRGVPELLPYATNDEERAWVRGLPFAYDRLDAGRVIAILLTHAGYRLFHFAGRDYVLATTLVTASGKRDVRFVISRTGGLPTGGIVVRRAE